MGHDDPWLCGGWFRGLSPEIKASIDGRLIYKAAFWAAFSLLGDFRFWQILLQKSVETGNEP
jgi:hypothetical protein